MAFGHAGCWAQPRRPQPRITRHCRTLSGFTRRCPCASYPASSGHGGPPPHPGQAGHPPGASSPTRPNAWPAPSSTPPAPADAAPAWSATPPPKPFPDPAPRLRPVLGIEPAHPLPWALATTSGTSGRDELPACDPRRRLRLSQLRRTSPIDLTTPFNRRNHRHPHKSSVSTKSLIACYDWEPFGGARDKAKAQNLGPTWLRRGLQKQIRAYRGPVTS